MENETLSLDVLELRGLNLSPKASATAFVLFLLIYIFIMMSHISLLALILVKRSLHDPMYLLFCNMSINDVFGASVILPHVLRDIFSGENLIHYYICVIQAFSVNFNGSNRYAVHIIMAFDRYMAICNPLRYATIMTPKMVVKLSLSAWGVSFVIIAVTVSLSVRLSRCRRVVDDVYCSNATLFKLSCENIIVNHIYGLIVSMGMFVVSACSMVLTYLRIAMVCLRSSNKTLNSKALQTCATHLVVYIIMFVSGILIIVLHRFPHLSHERKLAAILFNVIPPSMNAIMYGLQTKEVREKILILFKRNQRSHSGKTIQNEK